MAIHYDPLPVTDWASSLAEEYEEERRNRAIWDAQRTARDKQAEAADPGVTALKVLESAIEFSGTAGKAVKDIKAKRQEKFDRKNWTELEGLGIDSTDIINLNKANERLKKFETTATEEFDKSLKLKEFLVKSYPGGLKNNEATINHLVNLTGHKYLSAQRMASQEKIQLINSDWSDPSKGVGGVSWADIYATSKPQQQGAILADFKAATFGPEGLNLTPEMMRKYVDTGWDNFKITIKGGSKVAANKASRTAENLKATDDLDKSVTHGTFATTFGEQHLELEAAGIEPKQRWKLEKGKVEGILSQGPTQTQVQDLLESRFKIPGKFENGTINPATGKNDGLVSFQQYAESNGWDVKAIRDTAAAARGKRIHAERENLKKDINNRLTDFKSNPASLKLSTDEYNNEITKLAKEWATVSAVENEAITKAFLADNTNEGRANLMKEVELASAAGHYKTAQELIKKSGIQVDQKIIQELKLQENVRKNQDAKGANKKGSQDLVMHHDKNFTGLVPPQGQIAQVYGEMDAKWEERVTSYASDPNTRAQAVDLANQERLKDWQNDGGGLIYEQIADKSDPRLKGRYVYFSEKGPNGEPPGYRNHISYRASLAKGKNLASQNLTRGDVDKLRDEIDDVIGVDTDITTTIENGVEKLNLTGRETFVNNLTTNADKIISPIEIFGMRENGHYSHRLMEAAAYIGIPPGTLYESAILSIKKKAEAGNTKYQSIVQEYDLDDVSLFDQEVELNKLLGDNRSMLRKLYSNPSSNVINRAVILGQPAPEILTQIYGVPEVPLRIQIQENRKATINKGLDFEKAIGEEELQDVPEKSLLGNYG